MTDYQLSTPQMTVWVCVDTDHTIRAAAPVVRKFIGQPLANLKNWMLRQCIMPYEFKVSRLTS